MLPPSFYTLSLHVARPIGRGVAIGEDRCAGAEPRTGGHVAPDGEDCAPAATHELLDAVRVPLIKLALARSGDKGDHANIGVIARKPEYLPWIETALSVDALRAYFAHVLAGGRDGQVSRWRLPGSDSLNILLRHALGGGGAARLRTDPQGKAVAQMLDRKRVE